MNEREEFIGKFQCTWFGYFFFFNKSSYVIYKKEKRKKKKRRRRICGNRGTDLKKCGPHG